MCAKGECGCLTKKYKKGNKGGVLFSAAGSNWGGGTSGSPMFMFYRGISLPMSCIMLGPNGTACSPISTDPYQDRYDHNKKGYFDSEEFMHYVLQYTRYPSTSRGSSLAVNDRTLDVRVTSDRPSTP